MKNSLSMKDINDWQTKFESCQYSDKLINKLLLLNKATNSPVDIQEVKKAIYYAKKYHADQKRKSGEPYYTHPLEVAYMVADYNFKTEVIVASILHDIVEDTEITAGMILDIFGRRVEEMVDRLTRDRPDGSKLSVEQILSNACAKNDREVLIIKLADRLHNMQTIGVKSPKRIKEIVEETLKHFLSLAIYFDKGYGVNELDYCIHSLCYQTMFPHDRLTIEKNLIPNHYYLPML
jgi:(p)ppGpp synthase/HD superfamily hydrolase